MSRRIRADLPRALAAANALGLLVASAYAAQGVRAARRTTGSVVDSEPTYWAIASTMRACAIAAPLLPGLVRDAASPGLLVTAGLVQLGDALIGVRRRNPMMATLPALMGVTHLLTAARIRRSSAR